MKKLFYLVAVTIFAVSFAACSNDDHDDFGTTSQQDIAARATALGFDDVAAALPASDPEPCTALLQREQRRLAVRAALLLLHSGGLTPAQKERFIDYFLRGKSIAEIARKNNIQRPSAWESVHRLGELLSSGTAI